tara:strand:- start:1803 stop:3095 length:1293 start_codon:yes stop_codon:yes gene_type:complete
MQLILIELNELNFKYAEKYFNIENIQTIKQISDKLIKTKSEEEYKLLEPWIQWHTIHTGYSAKDHGIFRLGDAIYSKKKQIFEQLEENNLKVGSVSAMNTVNNLKKPSYFIPDPWTNTKCDESFFSKIITSLLKDTVNNNSLGRFKIKNYIYLLLIFFKFVRIKNYYMFIKLFLKSFNGRWRKALFLDLLIHEIHIKLLKKNKPNFSCVFFNAGAHIQHHYLLNSLANNNSFKNPEKILKKNQDPFKETLLVYNHILKDYIDSKKNIIIATGLTQTIIKKPHYYYRLIDHEKFLKKINVNFLDVEPRMSRDFLINFNNDEERDEAYNKLKSIKLNNLILFGVLEIRPKSIFATLTYNLEILSNDLLNINNTEIKIFDEVVFVALKNGEHNSEGYLFANNEIEKKFESQKNLNVSDIKKKIIDFFSNNLND